MLPPKRRPCCVVAFSFVEIPLSLLQMEVFQEINKVDDWLRKNKLSLIYNKSSNMIIGNRLGVRNSFNLLINSNIIPLSNTVKYLGVILDNKLKWQPHIDNISKKTLEMLWHGF